MRKLFVIRDVLVGYGVQSPAILDVPNEAVLERLIKGSMTPGARPDLLNTNPEDKQIWLVGEFDETTGKIFACEPKLVFNIIDYVQKGVVQGESIESSKDAKVIEN